MNGLGRTVLLGGVAAGFLVASGCGRDPDNRRAEESLPAPPPRTGPPHYIGTWANRPELCGKADWSIIPSVLVTDSDQVCTLSQAQPTATG